MSHLVPRRERMHSSNGKLRLNCMANIEISNMHTYRSITVLGHETVCKKVFQAFKIWNASMYLLINAHLLHSCRANCRNKNKINVEKSSVKCFGKMQCRHPFNHNAEYCYCACQLVDHITANRNLI